MGKSTIKIKTKRERGNKKNATKKKGKKEKKLKSRVKIKKNRRLAPVYKKSKREGGTRRKRKREKKAIRIDLLILVGLKTRHPDFLENWSLSDSG